MNVGAFWLRQACLGNQFLQHNLVQHRDRQAPPSRRVLPGKFGDERRIFESSEMPSDVRRSSKAQYILPAVGLNQFPGRTAGVGAISHDVGVEMLCEQLTDLLRTQVADAR